MSTAPRVALIGLTVCLLWIGPIALGDDWNQWRGPRRDGKVEGFKSPSQWPDGLVRKWSVVVGEGHSSPVATGKTIYQFARNGDDEVLLAIDSADGSTRWKVTYAAPYEMNPAARGHGKGPKSTPTVAEGKVFTLGITEILTCWDAQTGNAIWRKSFEKEFPETAPLYGTSTSPVVDGEQVIVDLGGHQVGKLIAFDVATGNVVWEHPTEGPGYTSPIVVELDGVRQLVTQTRQHCVGLDVATGKALWKIPFETPYEQNIVTPIVVDGQPIFSGVQQETFAVTLTKGTPWQANKAWATKQVSMYMSSPVAVGDSIFGFARQNSGSLFCLNVGNGKVLWSGPARMGDNASISEVGDALLVLSTSGTLYVVAKDPKEYRLLVQYKVSEKPTWAHPGFAGGLLLVKDFDHLTAFAVSP